MRVLIADDETTSRRLLASFLQRFGYEPVPVANGQEAWEALQGDDPPRLAILDWLMPGRDGLEICRELRRSNRPYVYLLLVTTKNRTEDIVSGLSAGADDYLIKPFDPQELRCRIQTGERLVRLEQTLASKVLELERALSCVKQLEGLLPICMFCKKIRDDSDNWQNLESYIENNSKALFSHSLCEPCRSRHFPSIAGALVE